MSYFDNSNGQLSIVGQGPSGAGLANETWAFDANNSGGNQLIYTPSALGSAFGFQINWTGTVLQIECEATTPVNNNAAPAKASIGFSSTSSSAANPLTCQEGDDLVLYNAGNTVVAHITLPTFNKISGSGNAINTLSGNPNPVIANVSFTKNGADSELTLTFDWDENSGDFSSFHIFKKAASDGSITFAAYGVTGSSGSVSINSSHKAILGSVGDGDKFWIRNNPTYTNNIPNYPLDIVDGFGGIDSPFTHRYIYWSVVSLNGVRSVIAKYYGVNTGFSADHIMFAFGTTVNLQGVEHSHTGSEITKSMQYKTGSNRYYIQKAVTDDGSGVTGWEDYGSPFYSSSAKAFTNFW